MYGKTSILIADNQTLYRECLVKILARIPDLDVVAQIPCSALTPMLTRELRPDVLVIATDLWGLDSIDTLLELSQDDWNHVVLLIGDNSSSNHVGMLTTGTIKYISRDMAPDDLCGLLRSAHGTAKAQVETTCGAY